MRARALRPVLAALLLAAGCVAETKLLPPATVPTTPGGSVVAESQGVRLVANGDAWRGRPSDLEHVVTPVGVRLENQSGRPLRVDPKDFTLVGGTSRFQYAALSPFELRQEGYTAVGGSGGGNVSLSLGVGVGVPLGWGPYGSMYAWGGPHWGPGWYDSWYGYGPGFWGPGFYDPYYYWAPPEPLPTRDMVRKALPEGTLDMGGTLSGFLYFQSVSPQEGRVTLQARLVDARTGEQFGTLSIPFDVHA